MSVWDSYRSRINAHGGNKRGAALPHGGPVERMDPRALIIERDANNEVYTTAKMRQCNSLRRWIADDGSIVERWCIVEDGTKYLTGEYSDNDFIITRGDSRIALIIAKDRYTIRLNRDDRFLIDDYASPNVLAYRLTKPFKLGGSYDNRGILSFVLQECNTEDTDNFELHIANYYDHFPRKESDCTPEPPMEDDEPGGKKVWI